MGSTSTHLEKGEAKQYLIDEYSSDRMEVVKIAFVGMFQAYLAVRYKEQVGMYPAGFTIGVAIKIGWYRDYYNFNYRTMDESMGPHLNQCPKSILSILSPLEGELACEYATQWRERCWAYHKRREAIKEGTVIEINGKGINFSNGDTLKYFIRKKKKWYSLYLAYDNEVDESLGNYRFKPDNYSYVVTTKDELKLKLIAAREAAKLDTLTTVL